MSLVKIALSPLVKRVLIGGATGGITGAGLGYLTGRNFSEDTLRKRVITKGLLGMVAGGALAGLLGKEPSIKTPGDVVKDTEEAIKNIFKSLSDTEKTYIDAIKKDPNYKKIKNLKVNF